MAAPQNRWPGDNAAPSPWSEPTSAPAQRQWVDPSMLGLVATAGLFIALFLVLALLSGGGGGPTGGGG